MRRLLCLTAVLSTWALSLGCTAPPPESEPAPEPSLDPWVREIPGSVQPQAIASGPLGDMFLGGRFLGGLDFGAGVLPAQPGGSVFVAHLDADGEHLMSGSTGAKDDLLGVAIGPEDNLYAVGSVDGEMSFGSGKLLGTDDAFLTAFALDEPRFTRQINGTNPVYMERVATTPQGNVVIAAAVDATTDLGEGPDSDIPSPEILVAEYGPKGELLWTVRLPNGANSDVGLTTDKDGNVYFSSRTYSPVNFANGSLPYGMFVAKIGADGTPLWLLGAEDAESFPPAAVDLATDEEGNLYVSGFYYYDPFSLGGVSVPPSQQVNGYVIKLSPEGKGLYAKAFVMNDNAGTLHIAAAPGGDLLVAMSLQGGADLGGGFIGSADYESHALLGRLGPMGEHKKSMSVDGQGARYVYDIAADPEGQMVLLGGYSSILDLEGTRLVAGSDRGTFVARLSMR